MKGYRLSAVSWFQPMPWLVDQLLNARNTTPPQKLAENYQTRRVFRTGSRGGGWPSSASAKMHLAKFRCPDSYPIPWIYPVFFDMTKTCTYSYWLNASHCTVLWLFQTVFFSFAPAFCEMIPLERIRLSIHMYIQYLRCSELARLDSNT